MPSYCLKRRKDRENKDPKVVKNKKNGIKMLLSKFALYASKK